jgi:hypothetical protein
MPSDSRVTMGALGLRVVSRSVVLALVALVVVGIAGAANSGSFPDATGDAGSARANAPDVTNVAVSSDDSGTLTFQVTLANRPTALASSDEIVVNLDLDQNPDMGSIFYGTEVGLALEGTSAEFLRVDSLQQFMEASTAPASYQGSFSNGVVTFTVKAADVGLSTTGGFNFDVLADNNQAGDTAPDSHTFNYQPVAGTPPPVLGPDTRPPFVHAFTVHGVRGQVVHLDVISADGRGQTADTYRIYRGRHLLETRRFDLTEKNPFTFYFTRWRVPKRGRGPFRFCVSAVDAAGNKSKLSCARIVVRRS